MINEGRIDLACSRCDRRASDSPEANDRVVEVMEIELFSSVCAHWTKSAT